MRAIFFGSPHYSVPALRALLDAGIEVPMLCTQPARRAGRGRKKTPTPVAELGEMLDIPVVTPERLDADTIRTLGGIDADIYVVVAYGRFIPTPLLSAPRHGVLNIHPSLLPKYRGPSPVTTALLEGAKETGVSLMLLDEGMDTGPILSQSDPVKISSETRVDELTKQLFDIGAGMLADSMQGLASGTLRPAPQDDSKATMTRLIRKQDGLIDWDSPSKHIVRMNRAFHPWPGTNTTWYGNNLKMIDTEVADNTAMADELLSGTVFRGDDGAVYIASGNSSAVRVKSLQLAGGRAMTVNQFIVGRPDFIGTRLGAQ